MPSAEDLPNPENLPVKADSLPAEPQGKPKNTGVGSLSLLSGSSQSRNLIRVSCIAGRFLPTELSGKPFAILSSTKLHFVINF